MICQGCYRPCDECFIEANTSVPACTTLFANAQSDNGTATIEGVMVDPGYWRVNNQSENVLSCYNADACLGGLTGEPGFCHDGYEGPCELSTMNAHRTMITVHSDRVPDCFVAA